MTLFTALELLAGWAALSVVAAILYGVIACGGWRAYWRSVRRIWQREAGWDVGEHGDLSEGR